MEIIINVQNELELLTIILEMYKIYFTITNSTDDVKKDVKVLKINVADLIKIINIIEKIILWIMKIINVYYNTR